MSSCDCLNACSRDCFTILDTARTKYQLRIKESLFISWLKPTKVTPVHYFFVHLTYSLLALFPSVIFCFIIILHFRRFKTSIFLNINSFLIANVKVFVLFIMFVFNAMKIVK